MNEAKKIITARANEAEQNRSPAPLQVQVKQKEQKMEEFDRALLEFQILACAAVLD